MNIRHRLTAVMLIVGALSFSWAAPAGASASDGGVRISSAAVTKDLCYPVEDDRNAAFSICPSGTWMHQHRVILKCWDGSDEKIQPGPWVGATSLSRASCMFPSRREAFWHEERPDHP